MITQSNKSSSSNIVADTLSKIPTSPQPQLLLLSLPNFTFLEDLRNPLRGNTQYMEPMQHIQSNPTSHPDFSI